MRIVCCPDSARSIPTHRKCIAQFFMTKRTKTEAASDRVPVLPGADPTPVLLSIHQLAAALNVGRTTVENYAEPENPE